jgi:chromosome segregation ATPase
MANSEMAKLQSRLLSLRMQRNDVQGEIAATQRYVKGASDFESEVQEQRARLESINALPRSADGAWQWPFLREEDARMDGIAQALLGELSSLSQELQTVGGARPRLDQRLATLTEKACSLAAEIRNVEQTINAAVLVEEKAAAMEDANTQASRVQGRVSFYLESLQPSEAINILKLKVQRLQAKLDQLVLDADEGENAEARMHSVLTNISSTIDRKSTRLNSSHNSESRMPSSA